MKSYGWGLSLVSPDGPWPRRPRSTPPPWGRRRSPRRVPAAARRPRANRDGGASGDSAVPSKAFVDTYCVTCHNQRLKTAGLALDTLDVANVAAHAPAWEKVVVKLRAGLMPPSGIRRPAPVGRSMNSPHRSRRRSISPLRPIPNPGRTEPFHRLNRAEYQNAIRDLLGLEIDATAMLPTDEVSYGFDNIAGVLKLSPLLTERYLNAAQKVARLALGTPAPPNGDLFRVPDQLDQDVRLEGMPPGTRGGTRIDYLRPRAGEYDIKARIGRGIDSDIPHFIGEQNLEISIDGERVQHVHAARHPGRGSQHRAPGVQGAGTGAPRPRAVVTPTAIRSRMKPRWRGGRSTTTG